MNKLLPRAAVIFSLVVVLCLPVGAEPRWHWEDAFQRREQAELITWIEHAHHGLETLMGEMPFPYDVHFHRLDDRGEPVPWANTRKRGSSRAVKFYVDVSYPQEDFLADWTAAHELTHLMFPYLGRSGMWFAEGIASYLQYQVMYASGVLPWDAAIDRYANRFERASASRRGGERPIVELPEVVRQTGSYVRLYWGGAAYFLEVDRRLAMERSLRLHDVIRAYLDCCFGKGGDAMDMMARFDLLSDSKLFSEVYDATVADEGFPPWSAGLRWLRENPPPMIAERRDRARRGVEAAAGEAALRRPPSNRTGPLRP